MALDDRPGPGKQPAITPERRLLVWRSSGIEVASLRAGGI
jgi:hypothetical protein